MTRWVLVTRGPDGLGDLAASLAGRGVDLVPYPVLSERPVDDPRGWLRVEDAASRLRWLALTSPRAAAATRPAAARHGMADRVLALQVAAVGKRTAEAAADAGFDVALVSRGGGRDLAAALGDRVRAGECVLHACGRDHRPELSEGLEGLGVRVLAIPVYQMDVTAPEELPTLPPGEPTAVLLTSPRATAAYLESRAGLPLACPHLAMGETTVSEARLRGMEARPLSQPSFAAFEEELCRILS